MSLPVITDIFRVAFNWVNGSQHAVNVMHFRDETGVADPSDIVTPLSVSKPTHFLDGIASAAHVATYDVTPLDGSTATGTYSAANWVGGTGSGDPLPQVARVMKFTTAFRGRSYRGRAFLPFVAEGAVADGSFIGDSTGPLVSTAWESWRLTLVSAGWTLVVASYKLEEAVEVTTITAETLTGTQRRRMSRLR